MRWLHAQMSVRAEAGLTLVNWMAAIEGAATGGEFPMSVLPDMGLPNTMSEV